MIQENIKALRSLMQQHNIDMYIVPTSDFHQSEYVGTYFKAREFMSGFTGSAGTLVVSMSEACLWVDGRYFIQAEKQVEGTEIKIMKMGLPNVPTLKEYIHQQNVKTVGFDGRVLSAKEVLTLDVENIIFEYDLVSEIWTDRPTLSKENGFLYDIKYCGESRTDKLSRVREEMRDCDYHVLTTLDDIAWLFNIRGKDIDCNPTMLTYAIVGRNDAKLYIQNDTLTKEELVILQQENIIVKEYNDIYEDVKQLTGKILLDSSSVNYSIYKNIITSIVDSYNPSQNFKAIKNDIEIKNTINAHIKDGVAMTKFMYWLKNNIGKIDMDELSVTQTLENYRKEQDLFYDLSFDTICGYKENAALMHYKATPENYKVIKPEGLLLIDSGGQYLDGTTDITRTFALGPISDEERRDFTITLKSMLRLQNAKFLHGTAGITLDLLARGVVYEYGLDYRCGTGHGVGHFLNVHEGPNGFRPSNRPGLPPISIQEVGMITTDEPGIYKEGKHGIRLENELLCVPDEENEYGQFLRFETITLCPIDVDAIDYSMMNEDEINQLRQYHVNVFEKLSPYLSLEERNWLQGFIKL
ncbi:MAG: aminopeptidase P family protein [Coprobacillaceae bacterium]